MLMWLGIGPLRFAANLHAFAAPQQWDQRDIVAHSGAGDIAGFEPTRTSASSMSRAGKPGRHVQNEFKVKRSSHSTRGRKIGEPNGGPESRSDSGSTSDDHRADPLALRRTHNRAPAARDAHARGGKLRSSRGVLSARKGQSLAEPGRRHVPGDAPALGVLTIDVGGTNVKLLATGEKDRRKFPSGRDMTPEQMVAQVKTLASDWQYDVVSIGYPGRVAHGRIVTEPHNLGPGWIAFDFEASFGRPVRILNDAAMQALGSYQGGLMLFIGLGTGLGSAVIAEGVVVPVELGHLPLKSRTYEEYVGARALERVGKKKWRKHVAFGIARLIEAIHPDDVVVGGGNATNVKKLPPGCRFGSNALAFVGGDRMWEDMPSLAPELRAAVRSRHVRQARRLHQQ